MQNPIKSKTWLHFDLLLMNDVAFSSGHFQYFWLKNWVVRHKRVIIMKDYGVAMGSTVLEVNPLNLYKHLWSFLS